MLVYILVFLMFGFKTVGICETYVGSVSRNIYLLYDNYGMKPKMCCTKS